jgi:predicted RNase H-like HicB family nuclease
VQTVKIIVWEEGGVWLGYLNEYSEYWTQGETEDDLMEHLRELYKDVTSGEIPGIRRVMDLVIS